MTTSDQHVVLRATIGFRPAQITYEMDFTVRKFRTVVNDVTGPWEDMPLPRRPRHIKRAVVRRGGKRAGCKTCGNTDVDAMPRFVTRRGTESAQFVVCTCGRKVVRWKNEHKTFPVIIVLRDRNADIANIVQMINDRIGGSAYIISHRNLGPTTARDYSGVWRKIELMVDYPVRGGWPADMRNKITSAINRAGLSGAVEYHNTEAAIKTL